MLLMFFFFEIETFRLEEYSAKFGCCCIPYFISSICVDIVGYQKQRHKCSGNHTVTEEESGDSINKKCLIIGSVHWKIQSRRTWLGWWSLSQFFVQKVWWKTIGFYFRLCLITSHTTEFCGLLDPNHTVLINCKIPCL